MSSSRRKALVQKLSCIIAGRTGKEQVRAGAGQGAGQGRAGQGMAGQEQARTVGSEGRRQEQGQEAGAGAGARSDRLSQ